MHFIRKVGGGLCSVRSGGLQVRKLSKSLSEFSTEIEIVFRNTHIHTHTHTGAHHYQCYSEEMLLSELLLKYSCAMM